jgi:hypothetical protein
MNRFVLQQGPLLDLSHQECHASPAPPWHPADRLSTCEARQTLAGKPPVAPGGEDQQES